MMTIGSIIRIILSIISIGYGLTAFPFPKEDRHKVDLALGCIFFILGGLLAIVFRIWWPLPVGVILGFGILAFFEKIIHHKAKSYNLDIRKIVEELDNDPQISKDAQTALDDFHRKELVSRLLREIEELFDKWDRETEEYKPERERIIAEFRKKEAIALAATKDEQNRTKTQQEFKKKEIALGKQLEERALKINRILDELNTKKEEVRQHLDPLTIAMLKEHNRAWRDD